MGTFNYPTYLLQSVLSTTAASLLLETGPFVVLHAVKWRCRRHRGFCKRRTGRCLKPRLALKCVVQRTEKENIRPCQFHVTSAWQRERGRHPTWEGSLAPLPAHKIPLIKLWNKFGPHDDSVQSAAEEASIISWRAGVRGCIPLHAGADLCQQTSRLASSVSFLPSHPDHFSAFAYLIRYFVFPLPEFGNDTNGNKWSLFSFCSKATLYSDSTARGEIKLRAGFTLEPQSIAALLSQTNIRTLTMAVLPLFLLMFDIMTGQQGPLKKKKRKRKICRTFHERDNMYGFWKWVSKCSENKVQVIRCENAIRERTDIVFFPLASLLVVLENHTPRGKNS